MTRRWNSPEERNAYHREWYWRHKAVKNPRREDPVRQQGWKHDEGPNRRCVDCGVMKLKIAANFEWHHKRFRQSCIECRNTTRSGRRVSRNWGLTEAMYNQYVRKGNCHICGENMPLMAVDHCHKTGINRGVLCRGCNTGLGCFKDNPLLLEAAISYLRKA